MSLQAYTQSVPTPAPVDLGAMGSTPKWVWYTLGAIGLGYYFFTVHVYNEKSARYRAGAS
jgi:hypothetical protein